MPRAEPSLDLPAVDALGPFSRTLGRMPSRELMGAGFMHKPGRGWDHVDYDARMYSLVYVVRGSGEYVDSAGRRHRLEPGHYFQRIPGYLHSNRVDAGSDWWECFLDFGPALTGSLVEMRIIDPDRPVGQVGARQDWVDEFAAILHDVRTLPDHELPALLPRMLDLLQRVLHRGRARADSDIEEVVRTASRLLSQNLERRLDLRDLCREHGWGYEHLRKRFHELLGVPPGHYRIRCRIDAARTLLKAYPDLPVAEVAAQLGYPSAYEFSAQFKRYTGLSPRRFRNA